jgi:hypothetical protein
MLTGKREHEQVIIDTPFALREELSLEDDIPCCVCGVGDYDDSNMILFCDGCDIAVHQRMT